MDFSHHKEILKTHLCQYQDELYRYAYYKLGSKEDAQDVVQEVFINLYQSLKKSGKIENVRAYLYKSVSNKCITIINRKSKLAEMSPLHENIVEENPQPIVDFKLIKQMLNEIPNEQSEVICLKIMEEMKFSEIADLLSEPLTTVKSRFKYGMDKLKEIVKLKDIYYELR